MCSFYALSSFVLSIYFYFASAFFRLINFFRTRHAVDKPANQLLMISAGEAAALIRKGDIKSAQLVDAYIDRVKHVNGALNAMVDENFTTAKNMALNIDNYLAIIDKNSEEYEKLARTKPLFGVPFTVKDNTFCKGFVCTAGVSARKQNELPSQEDSEAIKRLKEAGAILLGITNVPELALWWETSNTVYGTTNNPYDFRRTPGGSSGGEGALLGAAGSVIGLGNDVGGSLRVPALFCGVFGLKPSPGLVPSTGIIPRVRGGYLTFMATAGPMTRYASDLSLMMRVLVGEEVAENKLRLSQRVNFKNVRVFYMEELKSVVIQPLKPEMRQSVKKAAKYFEKKYDICTHRVDLPLVHRAFEIFLICMNEDDYDNLSEAMSNFAYEVNCFAELIKYPFGWSDHTLPAIMTGMRSRLPNQSKERRKFIESKRDQLRREIVSLLGDDGILVFPAFPSLAPFHHQPLSTPMDIIYTAIWNTLALPALACPLGLNSDGLPTGVQIIAGPDCERLLIAAAQDLEEGFGGWCAPESTWGWRKFTNI